MKTLQSHVAELFADTTWSRHRAVQPDTVILRALSFRSQSMLTQENRARYVRFDPSGAIIPLGALTAFLPGCETVLTPANTRAADAAAADYMREREFEKLRAQLAVEYAADVASWDWDYILRAAQDNAEFDPDADCMIGRDYLGSQLTLYPSGKIYAFWTNNQTELDCVRDEVFDEALDAAAEKHGGYIDCNDGDVFFALAVDAPEDTED